MKKTSLYFYSNDKKLCKEVEKLHYYFEHVYISNDLDTISKKQELTNFVAVVDLDTINIDQKIVSESGVELIYIGTKGNIPELKALSVSKPYNKVGLLQLILLHFVKTGKIRSFVPNNIHTTNDNPAKYIKVIDAESIQIISIDEILFIKSDGKSTQIHKTDGSVTISSKNIGDYEMILPKNVFFRIHNSFIANCKYIKQISRKDGLECILSNKERLPISKKKLDDLLHCFNKIM